MFFSVISSLRRHLGRTLLSMVGTVIGTFAVVVISTVSTVGISMFESELDSLGLSGLLISADNEFTTLSEQNVGEIGQLSFVDCSMPIVSGEGQIISSRDDSNIFMWGVNSNADKIISLDVTMGRMINEGDVAACSNVCIIDDRLAKKLFGTKNAVGQTAELCFKDISGEYTVVGIVSTEGSLLRGVAGNYMPSFVYAPYTALQQQVGCYDLTMIGVSLCDGCDNSTASADILQLLRGTGGGLSDYKSENLSNHRSTLLGLLDIMTVIILCIGLISVLVSAIGLMNVMLMSVSERTGEIGIKKALGASCTNIALEFMLEAVVVCLIASVIGVALGIATARVAAGVVGFQFAVDWPLVLAIIVLTVLLGAVFSIYPAVKAGRLSPIDALRKI